MNVYQNLSQQEMVECWPPRNYFSDDDLGEEKHQKMKSLFEQIQIVVIEDKKEKAFWEKHWVVDDCTGPVSTLGSGVVSILALGILSITAIFHPPASVWVPIFSCCAPTMVCGSSYAMCNAQHDDAMVKKWIYPTPENLKFNEPYPEASRENCVQRAKLAIKDKKIIEHFFEQTRGKFVPAQDLTDESCIHDIKKSIGILKDMECHNRVADVLIATSQLQKIKGEATLARDWSLFKQSLSDWNEIPEDSKNNESQQFKTITSLFKSIFCERLDIETLVKALSNDRAEIAITNNINAISKVIQEQQTPESIVLSEWYDRYKWVIPERNDTEVN